jgi:hypothetical protein
MHKLIELSSEFLSPTHVINKLRILQSQLLSGLSDVLAAAADGETKVSIYSTFCLSLLKLRNRK